jgi:hypothetical protein
MPRRGEPCKRCGVQEYRGNYGDYGSVCGCAEWFRDCIRRWNDEHGKKEEEGVVFEDSKEGSKEEDPFT